MSVHILLIESDVGPSLDRAFNNLKKKVARMSVILDRLVADVEKIQSDIGAISAALAAAAKQQGGLDAVEAAAFADKLDAAVKALDAIVPTATAPVTPDNTTPTGETPVPE